MLVLTRKIGQKIIIGDNIEVTLVSLGGGAAQLGVLAPRGIRVANQETQAEIPIEEEDMLVLSRKVSEKILIGDDIEIMLVSIIGDTVRIGINAPKEIKIMRQEVLEEVRDQNLQATSNKELSGELKDLLPKKES